MVREVIISSWVDFIHNGPHVCSRMRFLDVFEQSTSYQADPI